MWGRPASPRPAGLGLLPRGHRLSDNGSDHFLESVGSWVFAVITVARPAVLPLAHLGLWFCRDSALLLCVLQGSGFLKYLCSWAALWIFGWILKPFGVSN